MTDETKLELHAGFLSVIEKLAVAVVDEFAEYPAWSEADDIVTEPTSFKSAQKLKIPQGNS